MEFLFLGTVAYHYVNLFFMSPEWKGPNLAHFQLTAGLNESSSSPIKILQIDDTKVNDFIAHFSNS